MGGVAGKLRAEEVMCLCSTIKRGLKLKLMLLYFLDCSQYFLGTLSPEDQASRKTHCMVVNILAAVESFDPYDLTFEDSKLSADEDALDHATPLVWWSKQQWEILEERIFQLMEKCGATESALFQCVLNTILLNETLASIRCEVEEELTKKSSGPVVIDAHLVSKFV